MGVCTVSDISVKSRKKEDLGLKKKYIYKYIRRGVSGAYDVKVDVSGGEKR